MKGDASASPPVPFEEHYPDAAPASRVADSHGTDLWKRVFLYARSLVRDRDEAEDITQEAFVELFRSKAAGTLVEHIDAWMRTVTRRLVYRSYHERRPDLHISLEIVTADGEQYSHDLPDRQPSPEKLVLDQSMVRLSAKILSEFPDRDRECILMYFKGYDFAQIASALGVSRWTARRLTLEAISRVRSRLEPTRT